MGRLELRIIEGFEQAKAALSREIAAVSYPVSPSLRESLRKQFGTDDPEQAVRQIIADVRSRGDAALLELTGKIDGIKLNSLEVSKKQIASARRSLDEELIAALKLAAERIEAFHEAQKDSIWRELYREELRQLMRPLKRVGVYVPGGTAS